MRKSFLDIKIVLLGLLLGSVGSSHAQKLRLNAYGSYVLEGSYHVYYENGNYYEGKINDGLQLGVGVEYMIEPKYGIEFTALHRNTYVYKETDKRHSDLGFNYLLVGVNAYPQTRSGKFQGYGGVSGGLVIQSPYNIDNRVSPELNHSITKFTWAAKLGGIVWLSNRLGVKMQAQWISALQFNKGMINFNIYRTDTGPADYSIANQFELGSGFIIKLGKKEKYEWDTISL
jgi:hypothetical protein